MLVSWVICENMGLSQESFSCSGTLFVDPSTEQSTLLQLGQQKFNHVFERSRIGNVREIEAVNTTYLNPLLHLVDDGLRASDEVGYDA